METNMNARKVKMMATKILISLMIAMLMFSVSDIATMAIQTGNGLPFEEMPEQGVAYSAATLETGQAEYELSEARQKYYMLLTDNHWSVELSARFRELFGEMSPDYILSNYTGIFDITSDEMDQAVLRVLTRDAETTRARDMQPTLDCVDIHDVFFLTSEPNRPEKPEILSQSLESETSIHEANSAGHSLHVTNVTLTGFTIHVTFPVEGAWGNIVQYFDGVNWRTVPGTNYNTRSGAYVVHSLSPGRTIPIASSYFNHHTATWSPWINTWAVLLLPAERLIRFDRSNIIFNLDEVLINAWGGQNSVRTTNFINATNRGYEVIHDLVGGERPFNGAQMELRSTRTLPFPIEGRAGQNMLWQTGNLSSTGLVYVAIDHANAMSRLNANTTEIPIHEMAHNFDSWRWSFCEEALAIFMTYCYYDITGESMAVAGLSRVFHGGAGFRAFMRSYANRLAHTGPSYDATVGRGVYGPYGLAWNLADIQTRIGWQPFRSTFRHFHNMVPSQVPSSNIDKLNYFLSRLQDYSGQNVFNMFNAQERSVYEAHFGGRLMYVPRSVPPTMTLSQAAVTIDNANLTRQITVGGTATGAITAIRGTLPNAVQLSIDSVTGVITITGTRPRPGQPAVTGMHAVTIQRGGASQSLTVVINLAPPTLTLNLATVTIDNANLTRQITVGGTATGTITATRGTLPNAVQLSIDSATGIITLTGTRPGPGRPAITGSHTITIQREGLSQTLTVTVNLTEPVLRFNPQSDAPWDGSRWNPSAAGGSRSVTVITDQPGWSAVSSDPLWLTVTHSGTTGGNITITAEPNSLTIARYGTVTITAGTATRTLHVRQIEAGRPSITVNYRILVNSTTSISEAVTLMEDAKPLFAREFGITLVRSSPQLMTPNLNERPGCTRPDDAICDEYCGPLAYCPHTNVYRLPDPPLPVGPHCESHHHRSSIHFIRQYPGTRELSNFKFVDFRLCYYWPGQVHREVGGVATILGNQMLVSTNSWDPFLVTVHEIAHLFGALDPTLARPCTPGQRCVMGPDLLTTVLDGWCDKCWDDINRNRHRPTTWVQP